MEQSEENKQIDKNVEREQCMKCHLFKRECLILLEGLLRQGAQLANLLHALLLLLQQHALPVGHLLQLLGVVVDGLVLLLLNVLPALHAFYVVLNLHFGLIDQHVQI